MVWLFIILAMHFSTLQGQSLAKNWRQLKVGILPTGRWNAITDVPGVKVGQVTLVEGSDCRTGVTVILPHPGNIFQEKVPAAIYVANGFGKLMGISQVEELGVLETPIVLTNTLSVPDAARGVLDYLLSLPENKDVRSINPVVGETNDGYLNNIRARFVKPEHVCQAIANAHDGPVEEGNVGAGTGTICFGFKGGIGTASRQLPEKLGGWIVGVLVQTNFGGILRINGAPVGEELGQYYLKNQLNPRHDGSCMMVVATNAPLNSRQLKRLAKRAVYGLVRTGGISTHGSGDYVIAFSTYPKNRVPYHSPNPLRTMTILDDASLSPLFEAVIEAIEEAIYHSLFAARTTKGYQGHEIPALPLDKVESILRKHHLLKFRSTP